MMNTHTYTLTEVADQLCGEVARIVSIERAHVNIDQSLGELGLDSPGYIRVISFIKSRFGVDLRPEVLFEHESIRETAACVLAALSTMGTAPAPAAAAPTNESFDKRGSRDVAIVGLAFRLPGADNMEALSNLIESGTSCLRPLPAERCGGAGDGDASTLPFIAGLLDDVARFDASFFGISPREALAMDPQQRLLLECAWHAFEDAGYAPEGLAGTDTAVFIGASAFDYLDLLSRTGAARASHIGTGVSHAILANRISQYFNLRGPSEAIDTACSSSLVALWRGVETLRRSGRGMALVGGVNIFASSAPFRGFTEAGMLDASGRCLPFDERAAGYVRGEGVVCLVLKPLSEALADGDRIYARILGGAVRHSGRTQSLTAPNPQAQASVIEAAIEDAAIDASTIGYVEAHGVGSSLGDPIEIHGLQQAFLRMLGEQGEHLPCYIGNIKAQIGHLEAAAGLAGVVNAIACLQSQRIAGNAHLQTLNPLIDLRGGHLRIARESVHWEARTTKRDAQLPCPRRAGVSSFGFGGTNVHVVLEEAPLRARTAAIDRERVFVLSARSDAALHALARQLSTYLQDSVVGSKARQAQLLNDLAFTMWRARSTCKHRLAIAATSQEELAARLAHFVQNGEAGPAIWTGRAACTVDTRDQAPAGSDLASAAAAWVCGAAIDLSAFAADVGAGVVSLPAYPFSGERYWPQPASVARRSATAGPGACGETGAEERNAVACSQQRGRVGRSEVRLAAAAHAGAGETNEGFAGILSQVRKVVAKELEMPEDRLDDAASFEALGVDSIVLLGLITELERWCGYTLEPHELIRCGSVMETARYLATRLDGAHPRSIAAPSASRASNVVGSATIGPHAPGDDKRVAVVGLACRFPGAPDAFTFWHNLQQGVDSVGDVPPARFADPTNLSRQGGFIDDIERVYPKLFGLSEEEAADVDPLSRLFTECALTALDSAACGIDGARGRRVAVYAGARSGRYAERIPEPGKRSVTAVGQNFVAAHLSQLLDLRGPALVVDSACSSSLLAIKLACQALQSGDADLALAGGVEVLLDEKIYQFLEAAHALSPDGRCRPFSARANGFVPGEGVGCVVLKRLDAALADGDAIYAVIEGGAVNNDGTTLGVTTPGSDGQTDVIRSALRAANRRASDITYVETHGTGTMIGDPIELQSLLHAYDDDRPERCGVGSVKSNIGHLLSAAGVASFIKVALALHHRTLPPTLHCDEINPRFAFERSPFVPVCNAEPWRSAGPRYAGVSSFGFGKTNVHLVLGERPDGAAKPEFAPAAPLPTALVGRRVRAWHPPREAALHAVRSRRLLALEAFEVDPISE